MRFKSFLLSLLALCCTAGASAQPASTAPACRRPLVVSLYPAIPNASDFYLAMEQAFEYKYPAIDLIVKTASNYYDPKSKDGILNETADVYEVDCVLLDDFIQQKKIQPFPPAYRVDRAAWLPAAAVVYKGPTLYAMPHWLCANFMFYNASDTVLQGASSFAQLATAVGTPDSLHRGVAIDEYGKLTVGELYVNALYDQLGDIATVLKYCRPENLNAGAVQLLNQVPDLTYSDWGRNKGYHDKDGFYPRQYSRGRWRAFAGYSESLYSILDQVQNACAPDDRCINPANIAVKLWTFTEAKPTTAGWVDALALDAKAKGQKLADAQQFVAFLTSKPMYYAALQPAAYAPPRYLLPPYRPYYTDPAIISVAPLYSQLYPLAERIRTFSQAGLTQRLRDIGEKLSKDLKP